MGASVPGQRTCFCSGAETGRSLTRPPSLPRTTIGFDAYRCVRALPGSLDSGLEVIGEDFDAEVLKKQSERG